MTAPKAPRPAFAISGLVIVLGICLIAACTLKLAIEPPRRPVAGGAYGAGYQVGRYTAPVILCGVIVLVGWITYRITSRSDDAANTIMAILMSIFIAGAGYGMFNAWNSRQTPQTTAQKNPSTFNDRLLQQAARPQQLMEQQQRRGQPATAPQPPPTALTNPGSPPPTPAPPTKTPRPSSPALLDPNVQAQLDTLKTAITTQIDQAVSAFDPALAAFTKPPRADLADLRKRIALIKTARDAMAPLTERLRGLSDEAKSAAEKGGATNSLHEAITFTNAFSSTQRAFAADQLIRLLDQATTESQLLIDNYGRWKINKEGQIESKDFQLQSSANSERFFINSSLRDKDKTLRELKGE